MIRLRPLLVLICVVVLVEGCFFGSGGGGGSPTGTPTPTASPTPTVPEGPAIVRLVPSVVSTNSSFWIRGSGFTAASSVLIDGATVPTASFVDSGTLRVDGFHASVGTSAVMVLDGGIASNARALTVETSGGSRPAASGGLGDPRGMAWETTGGGILIFDAEQGILRLDPSDQVLTSLDGSASISKPTTGAFSPSGSLVVADAAGPVLMERQPDGSWQAITPVLSRAPTALDLDAAGNAYWADGSGLVGRRDAAGVVDTAFAMVPGGFGLTVFLGKIYVSDPDASSIHRISTTGQVDANWVTGLPGVRGLTHDGNFIYGALEDSGGSALARISSAAGTFSFNFSERPIGGLASSAILEQDNGGNPTVWELDGDRTLEQLVGHWYTRAVSLTHTKAFGAAWVGSALFLSYDAHCGLNNSNGYYGTGAIAEAVDGVYRRVVAADVCAGASLSPTLDGRIAWADGINDYTELYDPSTDARQPKQGGASLAGTCSIAVAPNGTFFATMGSGVEYAAANGTILAQNIAPATCGLAFAGTSLHLALGSSMERIPVDPMDGSLGTRVVEVSTSAGLGVSDPRGLSDGSVVFVANGSVWRVDGSGAVTFWADAPGVTVIAPTPYNDVIEILPGSQPIARLR